MITVKVTHKVKENPAHLLTFSNSNHPKSSNHTKSSKTSNFHNLTVTQLAKLSSVAPQTIRLYDRLGILKSERQNGYARRYSMEDLEKLETIKIMSTRDKISLAGIKIIMQQNEEIRILKHQLKIAQNKITFRASSTGEINID